MSTDSVNVLEAFQHAKQDCFETPVSDRGCELWKYDIRGGTQFPSSYCHLSSFMILLVHNIVWCCNTGWVKPNINHSQFKCRLLEFSTRVLPRNFPWVPLAARWFRRLQSFNGCQQTKQANLDAPEWPWLAGKNIYSEWHFAMYGCSLSRTTNPVHLGIWIIGTNPIAPSWAICLQDDIWAPQSPDTDKV